MSQIETNVRGALIQAAKEFLTTGELPTMTTGAIAWENRNSKAPQDSALWASVFYRPNRPEPRTIGLDGINQQTGFLQIDLNAPQGQGESEHNKWENKMSEFFAAGNRFSLETVSVLVTSSGMGQGRPVENHFRKSITVAFTAQLKRKNNQ
jgi:hypothetical protein